MDTDGDTRNCPCKLCSPDGADGEEEVDVGKMETVKKEPRVAAEQPAKQEAKQSAAPKCML